MTECTHSAPLWLYLKGEVEKLFPKNSQLKRNSLKKNVIEEQVTIDSNKATDYIENNTATKYYYDWFTRNNKHLQDLKNKKLQS